MWQDLVKLGSDAGGDAAGLVKSAWDWQQWYMAAFFLFMAGQFGWAVYENKWPKARPAHIFYLIFMVVTGTILWTSGFWK